MKMNKKVKVILECGIVSLSTQYRCKSKYLFIMVPPNTLSGREVGAPIENPSSQMIGNETYNLLCFIRSWCHRKIT